MDSVKRSTVSPGKSRLAHICSKVLHIQAVTGIAPDDGLRKTNSHEVVKKDPFENTHITSFKNEIEEPWDGAVAVAFLAQLFASISAIKAAYSQLQFAQSPYDADGIQIADRIVVSELKNLSELKLSYLKKQLIRASPGTTLLLSEIQEQKSLLKTNEITCKKLDSELRLKESEITLLKEKLAEANADNKSLEKKLNSSGQLVMPDDVRLSDLRPSHFMAQARRMLKSIRSFIRLLIGEMESAGWNLDQAASSVQPGISFWKPNHKCYAFESFVCEAMFDGFNHPDFSTQTKSMPVQDNHPRRLFFDRFAELKSARPADHLAWKPKSPFAAFCRAKYLRLVHPKLEASLFGNLNQRNLVDAGGFPDTHFFSAFSQMSKRVWLLHCLALAFDPKVSIFQVSKGSRFSEIYMESLSDEGLLMPDGTSKADPRVAFSVVPGFRFGSTVVQCQVYLR